ncbi:PD40 domain-containing protein, partial [candidate division KSB1 bacterium]|nr:PD40 domain-containing protein [candidate division KSB1 bacterium]
MKRNCFIFFLLFISTVRSQTYYVATTGNDNNPGTQDQPWATIQKAADTAVPGSTVMVRGGVYNEQVNVNVSGDEANGYITIRNFPSEVPVIDGSGLGVPGGAAGLVTFGNVSRLTMQGFELRNYSSGQNGVTPMGIYLHGTAHHISILENTIHNISSTANNDANAHGIAVYGTSAAASIHDLLIQGNELFELTLGSSEALVLNGNVEFFQVADNRVYDSDNIGLDFIGYEGTCSDPQLDRARSGVVTGNKIHDISSYGNPAYGNEYAAGGIYVDGGKDIAIENNTVYRCDIGIELASEHRDRWTEAITVSHNILFRNRLTGISLGGYDTRRGGTRNCRFINNTLFENNSLKDWNGEMLFQYNTQNNTVENNIFFANNQSILIANPFTLNAGNILDYNLYYAPAGAAGSEWEWKSTSYEGFTTYKTATGNDAHSLFADPLFADVASGDFSLLSPSAAIDAGDPDLDGDGQDWQSDDDDRDPDATRLDIGAVYFHQGSRQDGAVRVAVSVTGSLQNPAWSPDNSEMLFTRFINGYNREPSELYVYSFLTQTFRLLVSEGSGNVNLPGSAWNAATDYIVFSSSREPHDEIFRIPADGIPGQEVRVTNRSDKMAYEPSFSPDGLWVVFESHPLETAENGVIFKCHVDGTGYQSLTATDDDCRQPNWSPAGGFIVYQRLQNGQWDLWLTDTGGAVHKKLTGGPGDKTDASFSPDGKWIVYSADNGALPFANIFVIPARGGEAIRITNYNGYDGAPSWSPDGRFILFESCPGDPDDGPGTDIWQIPALQETVRYEFPQAGWYMVSLPVYPADRTAAALFPAMSSGWCYEWTFENLYRQTDTLDVGPGYWVYMDSPGSVDVSG